MMDIVAILYIPIVMLYVLVLLVLGLYGLNFLYLSAVAVKKEIYPKEHPLTTSFPSVTVQLPIFNERYVVERAIQSVASLTWPMTSLEIQVLDDSVDATCDLAKKAVAEWQARGVNIQYIHRDHREGYKSGALAYGLKKTSGEFIAIFDADFIPAPDFLGKTMGAFTDPRVGFVQARWTYLNRNLSLLTYLQGLGIDGHFMIEQFARARKGYVLNFNGTAGVWRRSAIEDAGGWNITSITEDLDLSYRAALKGWKIVYLPDVTVPGELVPSILAYRRQQRRWAQGSADCARRLLPIVIKSQLPLLTKIQAVFHLTGYFIQFFMIIAAILYPPVAVISLTTIWGPIFSFFGLLLIPITFAPTIFFLTAQWLLNPQKWWREIPFALAMSLLGAGLMLNNAYALWKGFFSYSVVFERTPKWGDKVSKDKSMIPLSPYQVRVDYLVGVEILFACFNAYSAIFAWSHNNIGISIMATLLSLGLVIVSGATTWEMIQQAVVSPDSV